MEKGGSDTSSVKFLGRFGFNAPTFLNASDKVISKLGNQRKKIISKFHPPADVSTIYDANDPDKEMALHQNKIGLGDQKKRRCLIPAVSNPQRF